MGFCIGLFKFSPVFVLAGLMISGVDCLIAAPIATVYAFIVASITDKLKFNDLVDCAVDNVKHLNLVFFILMFAYAMAESFMSTGVGASIVNISLNLGLTARTVAVVGFLVTSILSVATGTSWGTFAACAPIFLWLNHIVGGNILLTTASIAGGACFGNTMGLPTEVANASIAIDAIPTEVMEALAIERASAVDLLNQVKEGVPYYMAIPLALVLLVAIKGLPTLLCLAVGIVSSFIFGSFAGTVESLSSFLNLIYVGFEGAGSWVIVMMMWVGAFGGVMSKMNAFAPLSNAVMKCVKNVRQLMFMNGLLCIVGNAALSDEMAQIVTVGPITRELVENNVEASEEDMYKLRLRNATFSDALGVFGSQLIPWHVYIGFYLGILSAVYPLHQFVATDIIKYNVMSFVAVGSILILTLTGLDRFIPKFGLPSEPNVKLKKKQKSKNGQM